MMISIGYVNTGQKLYRFSHTKQLPNIVQAIVPNQQRSTVLIDGPQVDNKPKFASLFFGNYKTFTTILNFPNTNLPDGTGGN